MHLTLRRTWHAGEFCWSRIQICFIDYPFYFTLVGQCVWSWRCLGWHDSRSDDLLKTKAIFLGIWQLFDDGWRFWRLHALNCILCWFALLVSYCLFWGVKKTGFYKKQYSSWADITVVVLQEFMHESYPISYTNNLCDFKFCGFLALCPEPLKNRKILFKEIFHAIFIVCRKFESPLWTAPPVSLYGYSQNKLMWRSYFFIFRWLK